MPCTIIRTTNESNEKNLYMCVGGFDLKYPSAVNDNQDEICGGCVTEKLSVKPYLRSSRGEVKTTAFIQLIYSNMMGTK